MTRRREWIAGALASLAGLASGCASGGGAQAQPSAKGVGVAQRTFRLGGVERRYLLHVPQGHDVHRAAPLVLVSHGGGGNADGMARIMDIHAKAARLGMITAYPDALNGGFNAGPGVDGRSPNFGRSAIENVDDVGYIARVIDDVSAMAAVDPRRVFACGWSNGSAMSFRLAVELSDRIAAVAGVMSELSLMDPITMRRPVPMMYFWGTDDPIRRPGAPPKDVMAQRLIDRLLRLDRISPEPVETRANGDAVMRRWRGESPEAELVEWRLNRFGHFWPGLPVDPARREAVIARFGPIETTINASDEILAFFTAHPMPA